MSRADNYQRVTDAIIAALDKGVVPWARPWEAGFAGPKSMATGKPYTGINVLLLGIAGFGSSFWGTYKQITKHGGQVKKGSTGTTIIFWKFIEKLDDDGNKTGERFPLLRTFNVFNADQAEWTDGLPEKFVPVEIKPKFAPLEAIKGLVGTFVNGPQFNRGGNRAFYQPATDAVVVPVTEAFNTATGEFGTVAHELVHATGHKSRLDRLMSSGFGTGDYAREELVAEIGSAFLAAEFGIHNGEEIEQSASYIAGWRKKLVDDPKLIVKAAGEAARAVKFILESGSEATA